MDANVRVFVVSQLFWIMEPIYGLETKPFEEDRCKQVLQSCVTVLDKAVSVVKVVVLEEKMFMLLLFCSLLHFAVIDIQSLLSLQLFVTSCFLVLRYFFSLFVEVPAMFWQKLFGGRHFIEMLLDTF